MILTVDLGTSVTKVGMWRGDGLVAIARAAVDTVRPHLGWAEQDPADWWSSMVAACAALAGEPTVELGSVEALGVRGGTSRPRAGHCGRRAARSRDPLVGPAGRR